MILEGSKFANLSKQEQKQAMDKLCEVIPKLSDYSSPPEMGRLTFKIISDISGIKDPYKEVKEKSNHLVLESYDEIKQKILEAEDSLLMAVKLAIAGNIIDFGVNSYINVKEEIQKVLEKEEEILEKEESSFFNFEEFRQSLEKVETILYLGDNAGEIVFDSLLLEQISRQYDNKKKIIFAVRENPIINDVLKEDAYKCRINEYATVISSGSDGPGTLLDLCTQEFLDIYNSADMIISKGQGNFEALSDEKKPIFFLCIAKCSVVAEELGCNFGDIILKKK
jgi:damage-control phosphatase, subfamily I